MAEERGGPATTELQQLGEKLREARESLGSTIEELAAASGVSAGMISQIERGFTNPSFLTLFKLAAGLNLPIAAFFEDEAGTSGRVVRKAERRRVSFPGLDVTYELLTPDLKRRLEVLWVEMEPGTSTEKRVYAHEGEECGVVLAGRMLVHIGDEVHELGPGDAISYPSTLPHWYEVPGPERVVCIWAITPPSF